MRAGNGWLSAASLTALLALMQGCVNEEPRVAAGFKFAAVENLRFGMDKAEVLAEMGEPLPTAPHPEREGELLHYAIPGHVWVLGDYRTRDRGFVCSVMLQNHRLVRARVFDVEHGKLCECTESSCAADWATTCLRSPSNSLQQR